MQVRLAIVEKGNYCLTTPALQTVNSAVDKANDCHMNTDYASSGVDCVLTSV